MFGKLGLVLGDYVASCAVKCLI
ncbi:hypothetical protein P3TCK_22540 [Photobacterium profundum 3TCK]|uniref:Uncharacterized protein n=1 Tax=Photobacterium profundum 3TCK TaxID=314280 RepID=Q1Z2G4_9GAMM|nr:hypothetical protein P3TCK_22540 [Photobacterium profundum 3TCK]